MSYRIERGETVSDAIRRVASEEIALAQADLEGPDADAAVHSVRKRFKRLRALLRLAGDDEHDNALRDAGRTLAHARDRRVAADTARRLVERDGEALEHIAGALERRASEGPPIARAALDALGEPLRMLQDDLAAIGHDLDGKDDDDVLRRAVRRTWSTGRRRFADAHTWPTAEHLHEWRKRVKDLWYQATLLAEVAPGGAAIIDDLDRLGDTLGLDHDHAVLHDLVGDPAVCPDEHRDPLRVALTAERLRLQEIAWPIGHRIWSSDADAFVAAFFA